MELCVKGGRWSKRGTSFVHGLPFCLRFREGGGNQRVGTPEGRLASLQDDRYCCLYCQNHRVPAHRGRFDLPVRQVPPLIQTRREILLLPWPCGGRGQRPVGVGNPCGQGSGRAVSLARPPLSIGLSMPLEGRSPGRRLSTHPQGDLQGATVQIFAGRLSTNPQGDLKH